MSLMVKNNLLDLQLLEKAAECLRTLSHPHRLRMVEILLKGACSVGELAAACDIQSHMASEHLRLMKDRGFLKSERHGRNVLYDIDEPCLASIMGCIEQHFQSQV
ncbi:MAG: metalloregulator ArsR/SmtB family transcription factor [Desulfobulbaceae bacterium]|nr:metalloregulator ArsR/SmtB family transcription factor [Desulfobulbaceae bacterium]